MTHEDTSVDKAYVLMKNDYPIAAGPSEGALERYRDRYVEEQKLVPITGIAYHQTNPGASYMVYLRIEEVPFIEV